MSNKAEVVQVIELMPIAEKIRDYFCELHMEPSVLGTLKMLEGMGYRITKIEVNSGKQPTG